MLYVLKYWQAILIVVGVATVCFTVAYFVVYQRGFDTCMSNVLQNANQQKDKAVEVKVKNDAKFQAMPISDLDRYGIERGWVRPLEAR